MVLVATGGLVVALALVAPPAHATPHGTAHGWWNHQPATTTSTAAVDDGHGANVTGPYDPSGVGLPSGNGNGGGNGNQPCAGCVGNADDKNPPGQMPDGSDHNKGYECDLNHGIGRTNPAHSGCDPGDPGTTTTAPATTTTTEAVTTTTEAVTTTTEAVTTTTVEGTTTSVDGPTTTAGPSVLGEQLTRGDNLARTGGVFTMPIFALGLLLIAAGATIVVGDRRRRVTA